jgi:hypothetical protein
VAVVRSGGRAAVAGVRDLVIGLAGGLFVLLVVPVAPVAPVVARRARRRVVAEEVLEQPPDPVHE